MGIISRWVNTNHLIDFLPFSSYWKQKETPEQNKVKRNDLKLCKSSTVVPANLVDAPILKYKFVMGVEFKIIGEYKDCSCNMLILLFLILLLLLIIIKHQGPYCENVWQSSRDLVIDRKWKMLCTVDTIYMGNWGEQKAIPEVEFGQYIGLITFTLTEKPFNDPSPEILTF